MGTLSRCGLAACAVVGLGASGAVPDAGTLGWVVALALVPRSRRRQRRGDGRGDRRFYERGVA